MVYVSLLSVSAVLSLKARLEKWSQDHSKSDNKFLGHYVRIYCVGMLVSAKVLKVSHQLAFVLETKSVKEICLSYNVHSTF